MIVITGAAGFIGSVMTGKLNREGYKDLVLVDDFSIPGKRRNYELKQYTCLLDREDLFEWIKEEHRFIQIIIHLGARTDTTEKDMKVFNKLNLDYSKTVWRLCVEFGIPLIYASSAATYGSGESGFDDAHEMPPMLRPLNPYGISKNEFDKWALHQERKPYFWAGLKFFNVYGPNEYHKGRMASVVHHAYRQIKDTGRVRLFRSHRPDFRNGEQKRDFIYVSDLAGVIYRMIHTRKYPGIYNLGTGHAETFITLVNSVFDSLNIPAAIDFIDIPEDIRDTYQYFTEAKMDKLRTADYYKSFTSLGEGVSDYVRNYLEQDKIY
jgi:ADP-L-glycero-D-manno-heptose 6-epimerase